MTYSVIHYDKIHTHLSSSCIISSYFWRTLVPSGDSWHLQRRWDFTAHAKVTSNILYPVSLASNPKILFYEPLKHFMVQLSLEMHEQRSLICNLLCWIQWKRLTGRGGVWFLRRGPGCAAEAPGPISTHRQPLACSYSLEPNLRRSGVIAYRKYNRTEWIFIVIAIHATVQCNEMRLAVKICLCSYNIICNVQYNYLTSNIKQKI